MAQDPLHHHHHHEPTNYGIVSAPHGPETGDDHASFRDNTGEDVDERMLFAPILYPDDTYTSDGVYWADLPLMKRLKFNAAVDNAEAKKELGQLGAMIKKDPLSPVGWYSEMRFCPVLVWVWKGELVTEDEEADNADGALSYVLFSIGNLQPLFQDVWPSCWSKYTTCSERWVQSVQYLEVLGIIVGQILVGYLGDKMGRRYGLIQDAMIMFLGLVLLVAVWGVTLNGWVIGYAWSLFFYSVGVGGEYPMTATAAMENATGSGKVSTKEDRLHRGRKVTMAFLMQGWGQFFNVVILIVCLLIFHHGSGNPPYSEVAAQWTYRVSFAIPAVGTLWLVYYRWYKMPLASRALNAAKRKGGVTGYDVQSLKLTLNHFGGRLIATAGGWYANDVFFYGNKLFQSQFISVISPTPKGQTASLMTGWLWSLCNVGVELLGYYLASFLIDNKFVGRKNMQQLGFFMCFLCFVIPAFHYHYYAEESAHIKAFQALYFLSSFFNQFGPNSTTFLVAAEVYPTAVRATAHGFSAAWGKAGALTAAVAYNYMGTQTKFYFVPWFGLAGMLITQLFLPDTTGLDLKEQERRFKYISAGRPQDYHGIAVHPHHLSLWERWRGVAKSYNPQLDAESKLADIRADWESKQTARSEKHAEQGVAADDDAFEDEYTTEQHHFLRNTTGLGSKKLSSSDSDNAVLTNEKP